MRIYRLALSFIFTLFITIAAATAQTTIGGVVTDNDNNPLPGVSVQLGKNNNGTLTDEKGAFSFANLKAGKYSIRISHIGFEEASRSISIQEGETRVVNIKLSSSSDQLQNVEIVGRKETGYKNTHSFIGTKTATNIKDVPQSISYVTKELIQDQQVMRVGDVVKNMSGVNQYTFYDDFTIRGFRTQNNSSVQLLNGLRTITGFWKQPITNYLERVEVIKGPAAALFGNSSPGGVINRVTKKPLTEKRQSLSFTTGSFNTFRGFADFTGPMNESKTLLYRLNLGYENSQSFRDLQFDKNIVIAPSISFLPTDKTRLNFDVVYNRSMSRLDRGQPVFGNNDIYSSPTSKSINAINDYLNEDNFMVTTSVNHKFTENLQLNVAYLRTNWEEDLLEHRGANTYARDSAGNTIPNLIEMQVFNRKRRTFSDNASAYLTWDVRTGKISHKLLVGYDYAQSKTPWGASQLQASGYKLADGSGAKAFDTASSRKNQYQEITVGGVARPVPNVAHFDLTAASPYQLYDMSKYFYAKTAFDPLFYSTHGVYIQDQITFGRLQALLGLRYDQYTDKVNYEKANQQTVKQDAVIPRLGLVYTVNRHVNVYATYSTGYNPQTASTIANPNAGGPFDPLTSNLVEGGVKTDWFREKLSLTASVYRIQLNNVLYNAGVSGQPDLMRQVGKVESKGVELDMKGQITPDWYITMAYAFNETEIKESPRKEELGRQSPGAPKHQGSFWTKYVIRGGSLNGLGLGLGGNFVTRRNVDANMVQTLPPYEVLNAAIYYRIDKFQVQFNFNNLLNKTYWVGGYDYLRLFPGAPRNWLASVAYTF
jgi:iron complex outermembrane receptor protein